MRPCWFIHFHYFIYTEHGTGGRGVSLKTRVRSNERKIRMKFDCIHKFKFYSCSGNENETNAMYVNGKFRIRTPTSAVGVFYELDLNNLMIA